MNRSKSLIALGIILCLLLSSLTVLMPADTARAQPADSAWPMFGQNPQRTDISSYTGLEVRELDWSFTTGDRVDTSYGIFAFRDGDESLLTQPDIVDTEHFRVFLTDQATGSIPEVSIASRWRSLTPLINGEISSGEWDDARVFSLIVHGDPVPATGYLKSDDEYLYIALSIGDRGDVDHGTLALRFQDAGGNQWQYDIADDSIISPGHAKLFKYVYTDPLHVEMEEKPLPEGFRYAVSHSQGTLWEIALPRATFGDGDHTVFQISGSRRIVSQVVIDGQLYNSEELKDTYGWPFAGAQPGLIVFATEGGSAHAPVFRDFILAIAPSLDKAYEEAVDLFGFSPVSGKWQIEFDSRVSTAHSGNPIVCNPDGFQHMPLIFHEMGHLLAPAAPFVTFSEAVANMVAYFLMRQLTEQPQYPYIGELPAQAISRLGALDTRDLELLDEYESAGSPFSILDFTTFGPTAEVNARTISSGIVRALVDEYGFRVLRAFTIHGAEDDYSPPGYYSKEDIPRILAYHIDWWGNRIGEDLRPMFEERWNFPVSEFDTTPTPTPSPTPSPAIDCFRYPVDGYIVNGYSFGEKVSSEDYPERYHLGEDIIKPAGTPVYACAEGTVRLANAKHVAYGALIIIEHALSDGTYYCSLYGHLDRGKILVESGDSVVRGQRIGEISGNPEDHANTVPHLHFGVRYGSFPGEDALDSNTTSGWYFGGYGKTDPRTTINWWVRPSVFIRDHAPSWIEASAHSPVELRLYDLQGHVTGVVNSEIRGEIPNSCCYENTIIILFPSDSYRYEVAGTSEGSYDMTAVLATEDGSATFVATDIPTASGTVHQYSIDWDALSEGEEGVTVQIDSDGDGTFEQSIKSDAELTSDEFAVVEQEAGLPFWIWVAISIGVVAILGAVIGRHVVRRRA